MNKQNKQVYRPTLSFNEYSGLISNQQLPLLTRTIIEAQWKGFFRISEVIQVWEAFYILHQSNIDKDHFNDIAKRKLTGFYYTNIEIKSTTEKTQFYEPMMEVIKVYNGDFIQTLYEVFGTNKPISINAVGKRLREIPLQSHSIRRGAANHFYKKLLANGIQEPITMVQVMLRHQKVDSTYLYIEEFNLTDKRNTALEILKGWDNGNL